MKVVAKGHDKEFKMTISLLKVHFQNINTIDSMLISYPQDNFRKINHFRELVKQITNPKDSILILYGDFIQLSVLSTYKRGPIIFRHKQYRSTYGVILC